MIITGSVLQLRSHYDIFYIIRLTTIYHKEMFCIRSILFPLEKIVSEDQEIKLGMTKADVEAVLGEGGPLMSHAATTMMNQLLTFPMMTALLNTSNFSAAQRVRYSPRYMV